jgi:hypothetical protein
VVLTEIPSHQLFYYMSKSEVSDIFCFTVNTRNMRFPKVILERASYPSVTFTGRCIKFKTNKMSRKGKQRGVDIKQEDVLQAVVRKTRRVFWILTKPGTYLDLKKIWNPIDFQGQRARSQV